MSLKPESMPSASTSTSAPHSHHSSHHHSNVPYAQTYQPLPTLESLDLEGIVQMDAEASAKLINRLDPRAQEDEDDECSSSEDEDENDGVDRMTSVDWKKAREGSIARRPWFRRPSPYWLLVISVGHSISMGMVIAPKTDLFNQLACLSHYPTTSSDELDNAPVSTIPSPSFPAMPRPDPQQPNELVEDRFTSYLGSRSISLEHVNGSVTSPVNVGGVIVDKIKCRKSPEVQKAAAQFTTMMTITQGVLSALTTGWWGRASDKFGRTKVMAVAMSGIITSDIIFLATAKFPMSVPGGYRFLIIGPLIDGLLGGMPTMGATNNAYIADSTPDGTRAQIYSRFGGIMMLGMSLGPILGAALIRKTGDILSVFYFSTILHTTMFLVVLLILPESLSSEARSFLRKVQKRSKAERFARDEAERAWEREDDGEAAAEASGWSRLSGVSGVVTGRKGKGVAKRVARRTFGFLAPLEIFLPKWNEETGEVNWNLTWLALGHSCILCMMGVFMYKFQYVMFMFSWGAEELGPYLTVIGAIRALHLLVVLPTVVKLFKPKTPKVKPSRDRSPPVDDVPPTEERVVSLANKHVKTISDSRFDLKIIQVSLFVDIFAYIGIIASQSPGQFMLATCLTPFGGGAGPAINSMALALLPSTKIAGRLFGGMAVLQATISAVVGPLIFGLTYSYTTNFFPKAIFCIALALLCLSFTSFSMIRLAKPASSLEEQLLNDGEPERGRDRNVKKVTGGSGFTIASSISPNPSNN